MAIRHYRATLSQSHGREGWSVIFRHPVRMDVSGKTGKRIRRGLGTRDLAEAERLIEQLNVILSEPSYWNASARPLAQNRFDARVVNAFYGELLAETLDFEKVREQSIPLPSREDGYRRIILVGTTGAGKTTLVRQLLGTDPKRERFPSTSTAKTTIAPTEVVSAPGEFRAVVTFMPEDHVRQYLEDCVSAAVLAAHEHSDDAEVRSRLLNHVDQRFRLSYILGTGASETKSIGTQFDDLDDDDDDDDDDQGDMPVEDYLQHDAVRIDQAATATHLREIVVRLRDLARRHGDKLRADLGASNSVSDERTIQELFEDQLDHLLREDEDFHVIADELMDEVKRRFELLVPNSLRRNTQGWPRSWEWSSPDRDQFLRQIARFSSNYARFFGTLLTPLVNGIRVVGPFSPTWRDDEYVPFVLLDGEGLGHTSDTSPSLSTTITNQLGDVDAVILVDSATQPMQAAPIQVLRTLATTGHEAKLLVCFTHFDEVRGDNLPGLKAKRDHVQASVHSALNSIGEHIGQAAESGLRRQLKERTFFVSGVHVYLAPERKVDQRTIAELNRLLAEAHALGDPVPVNATPVYDAMNLVRPVEHAATTFHEFWQARLGRRPKPGVNKEHWARIKALSRRLGYMGRNEYDTLRPVADLIKELTESIYQFAQNPWRWDPQVPTEEERQAAISRFAQELLRKMSDLAQERVHSTKIVEWSKAFDERGPGSSFRRADIIAGDIYSKAAPDPNVASMIDSNAFLQVVRSAVDQAAQESEVRFR